MNNDKKDIEKLLNKVSEALIYLKVNKGSLIDKLYKEDCKEFVTELVHLQDSTALYVATSSYVNINIYDLLSCVNYIILNYYREHIMLNAEYYGKFKDMQFIHYYNSTYNKKDTNLRSV